MAKVSGPLFSVTATGMFKNTIIFQRKYGNTIVRGNRLVKNDDNYFTQKDYTSDSIPQQKIRGVFSCSGEAWRALTPAEQENWNSQAVGRPLTGFNLFVRDFVADNYQSVPFLKWLLYSIGFGENLFLVKNCYIKQALQGMLFQDEVFSQ